VIRIPIQGTLEKPRVDNRAVADLSKHLLQGVAERVLGDEINRQLKKLFRKK